jgi:hypothetical protein
MSSLSKVVEDEVQNIIELMFPSFKAFRRCRDGMKLLYNQNKG